MKRASTEKHALLGVNTNVLDAGENTERRRGKER